MRVLIARARQALADRRLVERAKGILIDALALSEPEAFRRIQRTARHRNMHLVDVARQIIEQRELLTPPTSEDRDTR
jgi:response regulator NasT